MKIGLNLNPLSYWVQPVPFLDLVKLSGSLEPQGFTGAKPKVAVNAAGWPKAVPAGATRLYTPIPMRPGRRAYRVTHGGNDVELFANSRATARGDGWQTIEAEPNGGYGLLLINKATGEPISVVEERFADRAAAGELFDPDFLDLVRGFDTLRFMDVQGTNNSAVTTAAPKMGQRTWAGGAPVEVCVKLANQVDARAWICLPHQATDAVVDDVLTVADFFARRRPVVEYSNEVWNWSFLQGQWAMKQGGGGGDLAARFAAGRIARLAKLARPHGVKVSFGWQTVDPGRLPVMWQALKDAGVTAADIEAAIITVYETGGLNGPAIRPFAEAKDVAGALARMEAGLPAREAEVRAAKAFADSVGIRLYVYEGGPHLNTSLTSDESVAFVAEVQRDPRFRAIADGILRAAEAGGVDLFCWFNLSTPPSRDGFYGALNTPSWDALRARLAPPTAAVPTLADAMRAWLNDGHKLLQRLEVGA